MCRCWFWENIQSPWMTNLILATYAFIAAECADRFHSITWAFSPQLIFIFNYFQAYYLKYSLFFWTVQQSRRLKVRTYTSSVFFICHVRSIYRKKISFRNCWSHNTTNIISLAAEHFSCDTESTLPNEIYYGRTWLFDHFDYIFSAHIYWFDPEQIWNTSNLYQGLNRWWFWIEFCN